MKNSNLQKYILPGLLFALLVLFTIISFFANQQNKAYRSRAEYTIPTQPGPTQRSEQCEFSSSSECSLNGCTKCATCSDGTYRCQSYVDPTAVPVSPTPYISSCYYESARDCNSDCIGICRACSSGGYQCQVVEPTIGPTINLTNQCLFCFGISPTPSSQSLVLNECSPGARSSILEHGISECQVCSSAGKWIAVTAGTCGKQGPITDADIVINALDSNVKYELRQKGYDIALNSDDYNSTEKGLLVVMKGSDALSQGWNTVTAAFSQGASTITGGLLGDANPTVTNTFEGYLTANMQANAVNPERQKCGNVDTLVNAATGNFAEVATQGCSGQVAQSIATGVAGGIQKVPFVGGLLSPISDGIIHVAYGGDPSEVAAAKSAVKFGSEVVDVGDTAFGFGKSGVQATANKLQDVAAKGIEEGTENSLTYGAEKAGLFLAGKLDNLEKVNGLTKATNTTLRNAQADVLQNFPLADTAYKTVSKVDTTVSTAVTTAVKKIESNPIVQNISDSAVGQVVGTGIEVIKPLTKSKVGEYIIDKLIKNPIEEKEKEIIGKENYKWYKALKGIFNFSSKKYEPNE